ncbi:MAG: methylated-DNA--[protein]-cysteine S-methyltransferase [Candidatus Eremiobacteraeota bacterium]|nr:methylated-DNA--[protein]-cysteine S-methyltransferase [Candidatus Eremiobacteraeota bacterium]MBV8499532.1 methylated-DNA--[protein]-cysteine S-methyltransferase [Candidatus Eremiobacteraeota bacterium]
MSKRNHNADLIHDVCRYVEDHSDEALTLAELAARASMSRFHFARTFKAVVGVTPKQYLATVRLTRLKDSLAKSGSIDRAAHDAGYGSTSRIYDRANSSLGMTPAQYRRGGEGVAISYAVFPTPLGLMVIGATDRGICFVGFGDVQEELVARLRDEYTKADIEPMRDPYPAGFLAWVDAISRHLAGEIPRPDLPLDIHATAFHMRVWKYLQTIPSGDVASYGEVAGAIGVPDGARAVAQACARNPVAVLIPCHRVIRGSGELGGYRWGLERKRVLIDGERAAKAAHA